LRSILEKNGHTIETTFLGTNIFRKRNVLFEGIRHEHFFSPVFLGRSDKKGIELFRTFLFNILLTPLYLYSILKIAYRVRVSEAQSVIVFYDMVGQLGAFFSFSGKPVYSISHHFFFSHKAFIWPKERKAERGLLLIHNWLASVGSRKILALSFTREENIHLKKLIVVPPLLREEITKAISVSGDHIHVYSLQSGFLEIIAKLAKQNPDKKFSFFLHHYTTGNDLPSNLFVFQISGEEFRESLVSSSLVICTAGFETPCEAIYLNKPLIVVPSLGHFEQFCNSLDVVRIGAATVLGKLNSTELPLLKNNPANAPFINWANQAEEIILNCIVE